jgi:eukaryotic-like serine/threonine-protein kinase
VASRYTIERELGRGGMATVYLARDRKHDRPVALKVLRPELAAALGSERFLREIRLTAGLQHPHILPLLDSDQADGFLYYVTPYVDGGTLRDLLDRGGPLPLDDAIGLIAGVAAALDAAHAAGVIHRDIKPENILIRDGEAIVSDFGIAVAVSSAGGERITETGISLGTPAYMSPEQAMAERDLDARTDVYSLGCVLYEMLAGEPPYDGPTAQAVLAKCLSAPVPVLSTLRDVPPGIDRAVATALAKHRADRFPSAGKFLAALRDPRPTEAPASRRRWVWVGGMVVVAAAVVASVWHGSVGGRPVRGQVAVLYFDNLSPDSEDAYLADGLTEEIIARLGDVPRISVKSRASVRRFRGWRQGMGRPLEDPGAVGRALGVTHLVTGSVRRAGQRVRVVVELMKAETGERVWGRTFDPPGGESDLFAIEDDIAQSVASGVIGRLGAQEREALTARPSRNATAYDHYLRGNFYLSRRAAESDGRRALIEYQAALRFDSTFAAAYGRLGLVYGIYANWPWPYPGLTTDSLLARGLAAADRALALDSSEIDGWLARGFLLIPHPGDPEAWRGFTLDPSLLGTATACPPGVPDCAQAAVRVLARATLLDPGNAEVWYQYGRALLVRNASPGSFAVADSALEHSLALDPDHAVSAWLLGLSRVRQRRWGSAIAMIDRAMDLGRYDPSIFALRFHARLGLGDVAGAQTDLDTIGRLLQARLAGDPVAGTYQDAMQVLVFAKSGKTAAARASLARLFRRYPPAAARSPIALMSLAAACAAGGEREQGLALLGRLPRLTWWGYEDPLWDALRTDPRFQRMTHQDSTSEDE